jgi:outer membrane protein assembly factor BamD (BamD/ComL family)
VGLLAAACATAPAPPPPAPTAGQRLVATGEARLAAGQPGTATRRFAEALRAEPRGPAADRALYGLGRALVAQGPAEYRQAQRVFDRLLREHPGSPHAADARVWRALLNAYLARAEELESLKRIDQELERARP